MKSIAFLKNIIQNKIFWYMFSRYATLGIQFFTSIYIAVKLGAYYFGIWSFFLLLLNIGQQFNWGVCNALNILLVQHREDKALCNSYIRKAFLLILAIALPPAALLLWDRTAGIPFFDKYHLGNLIYIAVASVVLIYVNQLFLMIFRVKNRIFEIAFNQSVVPCMILAAVFITTGRHLLLCLALTYLLGNLASLAVFVLRTDVRLKSTEHVQSRYSVMITKALFLFLYNACFSFIILSSKTLFSYYYSVTEFGYFAFGFSLANAGLTLINSLNFMVFSKLVDMFKGNDRDLIASRLKYIRDNYITGVHTVLYGSIPVCFVFMYFLPQYRSSFMPFIFVVLSFIVIANAMGHNIYMMAQNMEKILGVFTAITLLLNIAFICILAHFRQPMHITMLGTVIAYFAYVYMTGLYARKKIFGRIDQKDFNAVFPITLLLPFVLTVVLGIIGSIHILWLPIVFMVLLNLRAIKSLFVLGLKLAKNSSLIDLK